MIVGDFNIPLLTIDRPCRKKSKERNAVTDSKHQKDLTYSYRTYYTNTKEYTIFSVACVIISKTDHTIRNKVSLNRYKKIEMIFFILPNHQH